MEQICDDDDDDDDGGGGGGSGGRSGYGVDQVDSRSSSQLVSSSALCVWRQTSHSVVLRRRRCLHGPASATPSGTGRHRPPQKSTSELLLGLAPLNICTDKHYCFPSSHSLLARSHDLLCRPSKIHGTDPPRCIRLRTRETISKDTFVQQLFYIPKLWKSLFTASIYHGCWFLVCVFCTNI